MLQLVPVYLHFSSEKKLNNISVTFHDIEKFHYDIKLET